MSRYTGSTWKLSRRLNYSTLETGKELARRPYGPGQHGKERRKKLSEYGKQLAEKQKVRFTYGVSERQFRRLFEKAKASKGITGYEFLKILESRLDNLVYRLSIGRTRRLARQLVTHGHILVDGKKVDIPSYIVKPGQVISVKESSQNIFPIKDSVELIGNIIPNYVTFDKEHLKGTYVRYPERKELSSEIHEDLIVEYYNKMS
ncbi:30S ribosomal protein S4 [Firmicutes bacterium CAG:631]|jgi:ribosomal protein S4|nr:30S ribosomal protein S4 [Firmicutes bacterium CAG:631]